jgi:signal transduction histidine kinase/CheY-like chemotaxis protein
MNAKILIVDDELDILEMLSSFLIEEGFQVKTASSGEAAIRAFQSEPFDVVITDMRMPGMDGLEVMRHLKQIDEDIEVIILTAFATLGNVIEAFRHNGAFDYLTKPLDDINELFVTVSHALKSRRLKTENKTLLQQLQRSKTELEKRVKARTVEIGHANQQLQSELSRRKKIEAALKRAHDDLEKRVKERTAEIETANEQLRHEIEERWRIEEQIRKSKSLLQSVFDGISDPLIMLDEDGSTRMLNKAAAEYFNIDFKDALDKPCYQGLMGRGRPCDTCRIPSLVTNGQSVSLERKGLVDPNRLEQVIIYPLQEATTSAPGAIIRISDITEAKVMERQLIQSEKLASLGLLVSGIAHEINNPNNFISFNIPILMDYLTEIVPVLDGHAQMHPDYEIVGMPYTEFRQDLFKLVENIEHGSKRINATVSGLKEFSRKKEHSEKQWVDLKSVIEKGVAICRSQINKVVKSFEVNIPDTLPLIHTDPEIIEQVIVNLLINAAQASNKSDSWIRLQVSMGNSWQDHVSIEVSDNGCGMDETTMKKIFDPFFTTKDPGRGTGLGLYICHSKVEAMGGHIEVDSQTDVGSVFKVVLTKNKDHAIAPQMEERIQDDESYFNY